MELGVLITAHAFNACAHHSMVVDGKSGTNISNASFRSLIIFPIYLFCRCFSYRQHPINTFHSIWMNARFVRFIVFCLLFCCSQKVFVWASVCCMAANPHFHNHITLASWMRKTKKKKGRCKLKNRMGRNEKRQKLIDRREVEGVSMWFRCVHKHKNSTYLNRISE